MFTLRSIVAKAVMFGLVFIAADRMATKNAVAQQPQAGGQTSAASAPPAPATPPMPEDDSGFIPLFDGKTLNGWDGDPTFWRVEDGAIVGETTPEHPAKNRTYLIWRGGNVKDFELKAEFQIPFGNHSNSGIMYRSLEVPTTKWDMTGYQADMDFTNFYTGNIHGQTLCPCYMADKGQLTREEPDGSIKLVGQIGDPDELKGLVNIGGWNKYHLIVRGNIQMLIMNGHLSSVFINDDPKTKWAPEGLIGLQLYIGPPMKVMFRNILLKR